jgi:mannitol-1-phosphate/altronate dehydrogenase
VTQRILQFGASHFPRAHADLFVHQARVAGQDIGPITIVKTTTGKTRNERVSDILQNHQLKVERHVKAFTSWVGGACRGASVMSASARSRQCEGGNG